MDQRKKKKITEEKDDTILSEEFTNPIFSQEDLLEVEDEGDEELDLDSFPPGYRFRPTDEELLNHYLKRKLLNLPLPPNKFKELNIYNYSPMEIFDKYDEQDPEGIMYFFTPRDRKHPNGTRPNRVTGAGFWKASGKAEDVIGEGKLRIGHKRSLVYHLGNSKKSIKTDWLMHEYTINNSVSSTTTRDPHDIMKLDKWVLCKVYKNKKKVEEVVEEEGEVIASDTVHAMREAQTMQVVNPLPPLIIHSPSSSQMFNNGSHPMVPGSSSRMLPIHNDINNGQNGFSLPQYPSQIGYHNMFAQTHYDVPDQVLNMIHPYDQMVYHHNEQNNFSMLPCISSERYQVPPWMPNPPDQQNRRMDYLDWCDFTLLNQEELEPLDFGEAACSMDSDNRKPTN